MLDFIRQSLGLGVDIYIFLFFFEFYAHIFESWSNPRFDQDLNKFKHKNEKGSMYPS